MNGGRRGGKEGGIEGGREYSHMYKYLIHKNVLVNLHHSLMNKRVSTCFTNHKISPLNDND